MAQLWREPAGTAGEGWSPEPLEADIVALPIPLPSVDAAADDGGILVRRSLAGGGDEWCLIASPSSGLAVNGEPIRLGLRVLSDRDEILAPGGLRLYFSTERLARVEMLPAGNRALFCARCKQEIAPGSPAVRCPACGLWHHQSEESGLPCWTYGERCALCDQPTAEIGFRWTPEAL